MDREKRRAAFFRDSAFPGYLVAEVTNRCNARCTICPHLEMKRAQGVMSMELYRKIVDEAHSYREGINTFGVFLHGEPLLDKLLYERIRYAKEKGIPHTFVSTNAALLDDEACRQLVASGLDKLVISIDGATAGTYARIKRGLDFDQVTENARRFLERKGSIYVRVRMIVYDENRHEVEEFRKQWAGCGADVVIEQAHNWGGRRQLRSPDGPLLQAPCNSPWEALVVLWDGTVPLCCLDQEARYVLGDANRQSLAEIWRGDAYQALRRAHLERCYRRYSLCTTCSYTIDYPRPPWWYPHEPAVCE